MRAAAANGIAVTVHAIGDAAVRRALDLLEGLPRAALPHRIEHFQCVHPADLDRAARAGVVASMQPAHLLTDIPLVDRHWGGRGRGAYAFRSLLQRGTAVVFGSDVPVASIDPREGVYAALERKGFDGAPARGWRPEEKIGFEDVVRGYTTARRARVGHLAPARERSAPGARGGPRRVGGGPGGGARGRRGLPRGTRGAHRGRREVVMRRVNGRR